MNALSGLPPFRSPADILRNRNFAAARDLHCRLHMELYTDSRFAQLSMAAPRNMLMGSVIALWAAHDPGNRTTWPTLGMLKEKTAGFNLCSPRMVDDVVARLKSIGFIEEIPAAGDARVKLLKPSEAMLAHDRRYNLVFFSPLEVLFPTSIDYRGGATMDPEFHLAQRAVGFTVMQEAHERVHVHGPLFRHFIRDAGYPVAIWIRTARDTGGAAAISLSDLAQQSSVSRTHIRSILRELEAEGYIRMSWRGQSRLVEATDKFVNEFDDFVADVLSAHDLMTQLVIVIRSQTQA